MFMKKIRKNLQFIYFCGAKEFHKVITIIRELLLMIGM